MKSLFLLLAFILITTGNSIVRAEGNPSSAMGQVSDKKAGAATLCKEKRTKVEEVQPDGKPKVKVPAAKIK